MEITVLKCDRCKREVEGLIEFSFINRNIQPDEDKDAENNESMSMAALWGLTSEHKSANYPIVHGGLCLDCIQEVSRWLGHPENILFGRIEGLKNG